MKIVIDLPEYLYDQLHDTVSDDYALNAYEEAIFYGKILPKGHGRLIDADKITHEMNEMKVQGETFTTAVNFAEILMREAQTILEADKTESEM